MKNPKFLLLLFGLLFLSFGFYSKATTSVNFFQQQSPFAYLPTSTTHQVIKHNFYALSYNE
jgi:hypothetical protein